MKITTVLAPVLIVFFTTAAFAATPSSACAAKRENIERQIAEATVNGQKRQVAGLQKALQANKARCTDKSLADDREKQIKKARHEVATREQDLREAEQQGDVGRIARRKAKLDAARTELSEAERSPSH